MTVVPSGGWYNSDGLLVKFPALETVTGRGGDETTYGPLRCAEFKITATAIPATDGGLVVSDDWDLPKGAYIARIDVLAETACTGTGAVLNVGLIAHDRATEIDYNGIVAALALTAIDATGEINEIKVGSTGAGALMGTKTTSAGYLTVDYDTAAYTAGVIILRLFWYM